MRSIVLCVLVLAGCERAGLPPEPAPDPAARASPEAAVAFFLEAVRDRDPARIAACFSARSSEGEFADLVAGTASREQLDELAGMFRDAQITSVGIDEEQGTASVRVTLPHDSRGKETLTMVREGGSWVIRGF